ncbi:hypothetical protein NE857_33780 (plasmid) [Nocardiopsis exhalans]|uniref:Uncharacterized protein n=1 Tax=Nocardiopsis exhalans TaxID=163604 RepID=A0ABY5DHS6_9ACTN|nr:hypothetical protein [Nocardiopsis exhalans]USY23602.1 hypothetical protein NE857_33780 [Nocardiopsis exhalans]
MARITVAQARTNRLARRTARRAKVAERAAARAAYRAELHTVASHLRNLGADAATATGIAASLRKKMGPGVRGFSARSLTDGRRRPCTRYTRAQVLAALAAYKPRKAAYKDARTHVLGLAA